MDRFRFRRLEQYRVGGSGDRMELRVPVPKTPDGKANQRCPSPGCRPAVFQLGSAPEDVEAIKGEIAWAVHRDAADLLRSAARDINRRMPRGGLMSFRIDVKENVRPRPTPWREDLLRDLVCDLCGRRYGVHTIALFCPDCGGANLAAHFKREVGLVTKQVEMAGEMREKGDGELAYRLLGNAHEDVLTAF